MARDAELFEQIQLQRHESLTRILTQAVKDLPPRSQYALRILLSNETACVGPILATIVDEIAPHDDQAANL